MYTRHKQRVSKIASLPAPVGGIDETTPVEEGVTKYAAEMQEFFPSYDALQVRYGYREWVTGLPSTGYTLMSYNPSSGTPKLFVCTDDGVYDATSSTATPTEVYASITDGNVKWTQFTNTGGTYLICCNGVDAAFLYDGTNWITFTEEVSPATPGQISGFSPTLLAAVHVHKNRLWFIKKDTLDAYYLPLDAVAGALTAFPLGGVLADGGRLSSIFTWTLSSGRGYDDILIFQSSRGEIAGYSGTDPGSASTWALESVYRLGSPLGEKTNEELGGDIYMLTSYGIVALSTVVGGQYKAGDDSSTSTRRIARSLNQLVAERSAQPGWELIYSPLFQYLIINVPENSGIPAKQWVMNTVTGAWTTFSLPARTFHEHGEALFFTDDTGRVLRYGDVEKDNILLDASGGDTIVATVAHTFSYLEAPGESKHFNMVRPVLLVDTIPSISVGIALDFDTTMISDVGLPILTANPSAVTQWDVAVWDSAVWAELPRAKPRWFGVRGMGYSASVVLRVAKASAMRYLSCDVAFESGIGV